MPIGWIVCFAIEVDPAATIRDRRRSGAPSNSMRHLLTAALFALAPLAAQQPSYRAVNEANTDTQLSALPGGFLMNIPGLSNDFVISGGGQLVELPDGTARLTGRMFSQSNLYLAFLIDIQLSGKLEPNQAGYPPAGSPDAQLLTSAYLPTGAIDTNQFVYYTAATGKLTGVRNLDGAVLGLANSGAVQLGAGANNHNGHDGLQAQFAVTVLQQPPFFTITPSALSTLSLEFHAPQFEHATHPQVDPSRSNLVSGRAMVIPGVADDYVFVPAGQFTELANGTAIVTGTLARPSLLEDSWTVALQLSGRIDAGQANHPPVGSPVLQMLPSAYLANGGTMDPSCWHYYASVTGTLTGNGLNAGGSISLTQSVATQVGGGANQTNTYFGFYGAFVPTVVTQPTGHTVAITGDIELIGLTAVFPVLPFPTLDVPPTMPMLDNLTDQGFVLSGDNLAWLEYMSLNFDLSGSGTAASRWNIGYFKVIDNQHVEFHPRPGQAPGIYNCFGFNPAINTNTIQVQLVAPTAPKLFAEPFVPSFFTTHVKMHCGPVVGPGCSIITLSTSPLPSDSPGIVTLGIGNSFSELLIDSNLYINDFVTGVAEVGYGPINPALSGLSFYFQGVVLDAGALVAPFATTNVWRVDF